MVKQRERKANWQDHYRGQKHFGRRYTDHEVELLRQLRDEGMSYGRLAAKFEMPKATVHKFCNYTRR